MTKLIRSVRDEKALVLDFFAGSATTGHAVMKLNSIDGGSRQYILVQLPEPLNPINPNQKEAAYFCDKIGKPRNIAEITKERLRRAGKKINAENPIFAGDIGFRVFKLDTSNIEAWDPSIKDVEGTIEEFTDHIKGDRTEQDILYELLLKLGLDLSVQIENKKVSGKTVHSIGAGVLITCLANEIRSSEIEALATGIVDWYNELKPATEPMLVFRDAAFENDVAKTNLTAILNQHGLNNIRSL